MLEHLVVGRLALEKLLHLVNAPARAVEFVAEQLVGRAGRVAKTAVHALAQYRLDLFRVRALLQSW